MTSKAFNLLSLTLMISILSACGPKQSSKDARGLVVPPRDSRIISGPLSQELRTIQISPHAEKCDRDLHSKKKELVTALEAWMQEASKSKKISALPADPSKSNLIPFQGSALLNIPKQKSEKPGWDRRSYSWSALYDDYVKEKNAPSDQLKLRVNNLVRSLLMEDHRRVIYGVNYGFDHEKINALADIREGLENCDKEPTCTSPKLDEKSVSAAEAIPVYDYFMKGLKDEAQTGLKRDWLTRFLKRVNEDWSQHVETPNPSLVKETKDGKTVFHLQMDGEVLSSEEKSVVESIIEGTWKSDQSNFELEWASRATHPDLFTILFKINEPGQRPYVSALQKTMSLFPMNRVRSIAHEFGHVLGVDDHYYTVWDESECSYTQETNSEDLMSDSTSGEVTAEEWNFLLKAEPKPAS